MNEYEIIVLLDNDFNALHHYKEVFDFLTRFDTIYFRFKKDSSEFTAPAIVKQKRSRIVSVSHRSLEIIGFVERHWIELLIIFLVSSRNNKKNAKNSFQDYDHFIDHFGATLKEMISDFPEFEEDLIYAFLRWFNSLSTESRYYLTQHIKRGGNVSGRIKKILIRKIIPAGKNQVYTILFTRNLANSQTCDNTYHHNKANLNANTNSK